MNLGTGDIYEARVSYRRVGNAYILHRSQVLAWSADRAPRLLREVHVFRDAEQFQAVAPTFFPVMAHSPEDPTLLGQDDFDDTGDDIVVDWEEAE